MAGPGTSQELLAEIASRPGRDTILSFVVKATFIGASLLFLAALLFAPLITKARMVSRPGRLAISASNSCEVPGPAIQRPATT